MKDAKEEMKRLKEEKDMNFEVNLDRIERMPQKEPDEDEEKTEEIVK